TGNRAVIDFLNDPALSRETVAVYLIHKSHMIVTKYCDMVLEPSMREYGINFYERGMNIALANLISLSMPVHLNPITWNHFLKLFVQVARNRTGESLDEFKAAAKMVDT
ncbi:MAG: hypothetical protein KDN05_16140, partial [Verrucomicrobiae bacterium]|nr:hypothetical protein [Verrucomicrobiae bacterium]